MDFESLVSRWLLTVGVANPQFVSELDWAIFDAIKYRYRGRELNANRIGAWLKSVRGRPLALGYRIEGELDRHTKLIRWYLASGEEL